MTREKGVGGFRDEETGLGLEGWERVSHQTLTREDMWVLGRAQDARLTEGPVLGATGA